MRPAPRFSEEDLARLKAGVDLASLVAQKIRERLPGAKVRRPELESVVGALRLVTGGKMPSRKRVRAAMSAELCVGCWMRQAFCMPVTASNRALFRPMSSGVSPRLVPLRFSWVRGRSQGRSTG